MCFPIPSSVTYAFAEGSFGLRFPFGLRFVVFFVVGGRKNQDFTPLTEYPPGGVLRNDYFANGRGLGHAPGLLQIWALSGVPRALVCSVRAAVGRGAADRASVSFRGIPEGPAAGPSATLCVCTGSSSRPAAPKLISVPLVPPRSSASGPLQGSGCSQLLDWCPLVAHL